MIRALNAVEDKTVAHDSTAAWYRRGLDVRSLPAKSQLALVAQHPSRYFAHQTELELGGRPSRMGQLLARTALPGPTEQLVASGLNFFERSVDWTTRRMIPQLARETNAGASSATGVGT